MVFKKTNFQKRANFRRLDSSKEKIKGSRFGIVVLFLGTGFLSALFWLKTQAGDWREKLNKPFIYKIVGNSSESLAKVIGIKPDLSGLEGIKETVNQLTKDVNGEYSIYFYQLREKESFGIKEDQVFIAASVNKIPIMVSFYQQVDKGAIKETEEYVLKKEDIQDYGAGSMRYQEPGAKYKYSDLIDLIGKESDNTAAYVMVGILGKKIQFGLDELGMKNTSVDENTTTAKEMGDYLVRLYENKLVPDKYKEKIFDILTDTDFEDRITPGVPDYIQVAHKIGNEVQIYNDCGIILSSSPYVLCILTRGIFENEALDVIPKISKVIWEYNKSL